MTTSDRRSGNPSPSVDAVVYDPVGTFGQVFAGPMLAEHLGAQLTCIEVNVLAGVLEFSLHDRAAATRWLTAHGEHCAEPALH
ncbi:hypothetical protein [Saccharothrix sp. Mg75]|uniref:hypothetical protein n=1 Tax=Saccharothrix sp. Mg75 TaxID=3445357 RepID=UPI003EEB67B7